MSGLRYTCACNILVPIRRAFMGECGPGRLLPLLPYRPLFHQLRSNIDLQTSILRTEIVWTHLRTMLIKMSPWEASARRAQAVQSNRRRRANDCVCIAFMSNLCLFKWPLLLFTHSHRGDFSALPRPVIFFISELLPSRFPQNPMRLDSPSDNEEQYTTTPFPALWSTIRFWFY